MRTVLLQLLLAVSLWAQSDTTRLETIEVRAPEQINTPNSTILHSSDWEGKADNLAQLLSFFPAVQSHLTGSWGAFQTISIQGMGGQRLLVMLDGYPLNESFGGAVDLAQINLHNLASVELITGNSWQAGSAMGGVLLLHSQSQNTWGLEGQYGSQAYSHLNAWIGWGQNLHSEITVLAERADNDFSFTDNQVAPYRNQSVNRVMLNDSMERLETSFKLRGQWGQQIWQSQWQWKFNLQDLPGGSGHWDPGAYWTAQQGIWDLDWRTWTEYFCLENGLRANWEKDGLIWTAQDVDFVGNSTHGGQYIQENQGIQDRAQFASHWQNWEWNASAQGAWQELNPQSAYASYFPADTVQRVDGHFNLEIAYHLPWWDLRLAGLGQFQQWQDYSQHNGDYADNRLDWSANLSRSQGEWIGSIQGGRAARVPTLYERFGSGQAYLGNPKIQPEEDLYVQGDLSWVHPHWSWSAGLYQKNIDNAILPFASGGQVKFLNQGGALIQGISQDLKVYNSWIQFDLNGTLQSTQSRSDLSYENGNWLPGESPLKVNNQLDLTHWNWDLGWQGQYWSDYYLDITNLHRVPPGQRHNFSLTWKASSDWMLRAEILNAFNHFDESIYNSVPAPGRRLALSIRYSPTAQEKP